MSKIQKILFFAFLGFLGAIIYLEATKPLPVNWFPSYVHTDTIPLGTKVFHDVFKEKLGDTLKKLEASPFIALKDSTLNGTYFFINDVVNFDKAEFKHLYTWIEKGNTVFISANYISSVLKDSLNFETQTAWLPNKITTEPLLNFSNFGLQLQQPLHIKRDIPVPYFEKLDTINQIILGYSQPYNNTLKITQPNVNFIKQSIGKGTLIIHLQPEVFSNYVLLDSNENIKYVENLLSYVNVNQPVYWDQHYKTGKPINTSPLQYLLGNRYFKWAYYLVLIGAVLFVLVEGKRKQRSIPIYKSLTNKSIEYTQTIAGMYYDKQEYTQIAKKQIALFMEYVRTRLRETSSNFDKTFIANVASRSGNTEEDTKALFKKIAVLNKQTIITETELHDLYNDIAYFKKNTHGYN